MITETRIADLKKRIKEEVRACLDERDEWLLVNLFRKEDGSISIGSDTVFCGFENSSELRGPRWRSLENAREFTDQGFRWLIAGDVSAWVLFQQLKSGTVPPIVIMHTRAVERWAPECAKPKPALNSVQGLVNPALPENRGLAARRPGRSTRDRLKDRPCAICGSRKGITLHHLIPREMGGATEEENLLPACRPCHDSIHNGEVDVSHLVLEVFVNRTQNIIKAITE